MTRHDIRRCGPRWTGVMRCSIELNSDCSNAPESHELLETLVSLVDKCRRPQRRPRSRLRRPPHRRVRWHTCHRPPRPRPLQRPLRPHNGRPSLRAAYLQPRRRAGSCIDGLARLVGDTLLQSRSPLTSGRIRTLRQISCGLPQRPDLADSAYADRPQAVQGRRASRPSRVRIPDPLPSPARWLRTGARDLAQSKMPE
jgi:hypothetical protein